MVNPELAAFHRRGLRRLDTAFGPEIFAINWLSNCGCGPNPNLAGTAVATIANVGQACACEDAIRIRTGAGNDMRAYLWPKFSDHYQLWNEVVAAVNPLAEPGALAIQAFCDLHQLRNWCQVTMRLDIVGYGIWVYYSEFPDFPTTPVRPMQYYRAGRLLCGWRGDIKRWPDVELLYY